MILYTDSREQDELRFSKVNGVEYLTSCLSVGDYFASYVIEGKVVESSSVVERKSIADLFGSYTSGYENERKKFIRAKELEKKFILAVEGTVSEIMQGYTYTKGGVDYRHKKEGISMLRQLMSCCHKYEITTWFCSNRKEMALIVQEYFLAEERHLEKLHAEELCKKSISQDHTRPVME